MRPIDRRGPGSLEPVDPERGGFVWTTTRKGTGQPAYPLERYPLTTRVSHVCGTCGDTIEAGERALRFVFLDSAHLLHSMTCSECPWPSPSAYVFRRRGTTKRGSMTGDRTAARNAIRRANGYGNLGHS